MTGNYVPPPQRRISVEKTLTLCITFLFGFFHFILDASGWWTGKLRGKEGLFPANYVEKV